ncbi:hypothetical protein BROUX41_004425 [Berkeleyomyces rouxiae]|uniref:uncharacterized protein n=1 Tax=Berkeleyomyces rouxiae TaxID=2035830 RepID=UPI003B82B206
MEHFSALAQRAILFLSGQQQTFLVDRADAMPVRFVYIKPKPIVHAHVVFNAVLAFFTVLVVVLRVLSRMQSHQGTSNFGLDDFFVCIALPQALVMLVIQGLLLIAYEMVFATSTLCIKLSALFFYLRVFVNRSLKLAAKGTMIFVLLWSVGNILQVFLICRPFRAAYDPATPGTCGSQKASFIAIGTFNAVTDVMILVLPIRTVWALKARLSMKIALTAVFTIGLLVTAVSVWRIVALTKLDMHNDLTGTMIYASFLSTTEPLLGIMCISLPMLRPTTHLFCSRGRRSGSNANAKHNNSHNLYGQGDISASTNASGSKPTRRLEQDMFAMNTLCAEDDEEIRVGYALKGHRTASRNSDDTNGSETELNGSRTQEDVQDGITLQRKWVVSHI